MQLSQIRYFLMLCEERSFTRAAKRCGIAQPSLTNAIRRMEQKLGGTLFYRQRGNIELTKLGHAVAPYLREADQCLSRAQRKASELVAARTDRQSHATEASIADAAVDR